jgi:DNA (cytosine-5)-methyltransferase 1
VENVIIGDGCCGAGGAARGYVNAGHLVYGIDSNAVLRQDYLKSGARDFLEADILEALAAPWARNVGFWHVSPPCQRYSRMSNCRPGVAQEYPDLIGPVRELLIATGVPFVLENVPGSPLKDPVTLCMSMFGRPAYRHRWFETGNGFSFTAPACPAAFHPDVPRNKECGWPHHTAAARAGHWEPGKFVSISGHERRGPVNAAMEIDWCTRREDVAEAIPPVFTHHLITTGRFGSPSEAASDGGPDRAAELR